MKIMTILGIRPDFIRMSEIIKRLDASPLIEHVLVHTGQHYSYAMDQIFFEEMGLRAPDYNCEVGSGTHGEQTGKVIIATEKIRDDHNIRCRDDVKCLFQVLLRGVNDSFKRCHSIRRSNNATSRRYPVKQLLQASLPRSRSCASRSSGSRPPKTPSMPISEWVAPAS